MSMSRDIEGGYVCVDLQSNSCIGVLSFALYQEKKGAD